MGDLIIIKIDQAQLKAKIILGVLQAANLTKQ